MSPRWMPLLYLSSSFGRGKALFLRQAARHLHKTVDRSVCLTGGSQAYGVGQLVRSTVGMDTFSDLPTERPMFLRWVALGAAVRPAESADADVARRLTMSLPVCVVDDEALDPKSLL